jgi:hypothetical protein
MSLINDALRRANQAKKKPPADSDQHVLQPVESRRSKTNSAPLILFALAGIALIVGGWFFWRASQGTRSPKKAAAEVPATNFTSVPETISKPVVSETRKIEQTSVAPAMISPPITNASATNVAETGTNAATTNAVAANPEATTNAVPPPPAQPVFKLQGIFVHTASSVAMINGKTVQTGDRISGARVAKISKDSVTLDWNGKTILLQMP